MNIPCTFIHGTDFAITRQQISLCGYLIPINFRWNGASIPVIFSHILMLTPFHRKLRRASLLHDYLYVYAASSRREADIQYRILCREDNLDIIRAWTMYAALRLFGWIAWYKLRMRNNGKTENN